VGGVEVWELLHFVTLMHVWVDLCCCSGGCLCQGSQGAGFAYSWYSRIVSSGKCIGGRGSVVTGSGRIEVGDEDGRKWMRRCRKSSREAE
jgi:hypothetical protein